MDQTIMATQLICAVRANDLHTINQLFNAGYSVNKSDGWGWTGRVLAGFAHEGRPRRFTAAHASATAPARTGQDVTILGMGGAMLAIAQRRVPRIADPHDRRDRAGRRRAILRHLARLQAFRGAWGRHGGLAGQDFPDHQDQQCQPRQDQRRAFHQPEVTQDRSR